MPRPGDYLSTGRRAACGAGLSRPAGRRCSWQVACRGHRLCRSRVRPWSLKGAARARERDPGRARARARARAWGRALGRALTARTPGAERSIRMRPPKVPATAPGAEPLGVRRCRRVSLRCGRACGLGHRFRPGLGRTGQRGISATLGHRGSRRRLCRLRHGGRHRCGRLGGRIARRGGRYRRRNAGRRRWRALDRPPRAVVLHRGLLAALRVRGPLALGLVELLLRFVELLLRLIGHLLGLVKKSHWWLLKVVAGCGPSQAGLGPRGKGIPHGPSAAGIPAQSRSCRDPPQLSTLSGASTP